MAERGREQGREAPVEIRNGDRVSSAVLLALALYLVYEASGMAFGTLTRPGPGFFPVVLAILLGIAASVVLARSLGTATLSTTVRFGRGTANVLLTVAGIALYAIVLPRAGYLLSTVVLVFLLLLGIGRVGLWRSVALAVIGTAAVYLVFTQLGIPLPKGFLRL